MDVYCTFLFCCISVKLWLAVTDTESCLGGTNLIRKFKCPILVIYIKIVSNFVFLSGYYSENAVKKNCFSNKNSKINYCLSKLCFY